MKQYALLEAHNKARDSFVRQDQAGKKMKVTKEAADYTTFKKVAIPALRLKKLFVDRFKPYKHGEQVRRDLFKHLGRGLWNVIAGTFWNLPTSIINFFITAPIKAAITKQFTNKHFWKAEFADVARAFTRITLGAAQLVTWALNPIFMPIRGLITLIKGKPKLEDNDGFRKLAGLKFQHALVNEDVDKQSDILTALYQKAAKNIRRGQKTTHDFPVKTVLAGDKAIRTAKMLEAKLKRQLMFAMLKGEEVSDAEVNRVHTNIFRPVKEYLGNPAERVTLFRSAISERDHQRAEAKAKTAHAPRRAHGQGR